MTARISSSARPARRGPAPCRAGVLGTTSSSRSSGSDSRTGPGPAAERLRGSPRHAAGTSRRVRLDGPLGEPAEGRDLVDLLERLPAAERALDLADDREHRRRVLARRVDADREVGGAHRPGPEAAAGRPVSWPWASAMNAAPPSWRVATTRMPAASSASSRPRNDSPGDGERVADAGGAQRVGDDGRPTRSGGSARARLGSRPARAGGAGRLGCGRPLGGSASAAARRSVVGLGRGVGRRTSPSAASARRLAAAASSRVGSSARRAASPVGGRRRRRAGALAPSVMDVELASIGDALLGRCSRRRVARQR